MARYFNGKLIELLAPSGNMETFRVMVEANCDAIYLGGKSLNMRMIRKGYNFSDEEIAEAVELAHAVGKKVYVTVNNMLNDEEISKAVEFLLYLEKINVDGIIVQDLGIIQLCHEHNIKGLEIHSSVMMNVHNIEFVKALKDLGLTRVVLSREMDLKTAKQLQTETGLETEYFIHGDMCTVNGSNCYYSSIVLGNSSNRGRCFKPCRWSFQVKKDGNVYNTEYPLAAKDMYMYEHIPELIEANITSFKIEGRMRDTEFIVNLVNAYGDAIDRYIENPLNFDRKKAADLLQENRKRDFSTAYAFGKPGLDFINTRYEGTGKFYSTGKMFSTPTEEPEVSEELVTEIMNELKAPAITEKHDNKLSVKVNNFEQAKLCIELNVDRVYLPIEVYAPDSVLTVDELKYLVTNKKDTEIFLDLPQMMTEIQFEMIDQYLALYGDLLDGLLVSNLGAVRKYGSTYRLIANFNMNIYNQKSQVLYKQLGVDEFTVSIEMKKQELANYLAKTEEPLEIIVHGPLRVMYLDLDLYENTSAFEAVDNKDNLFIDNSTLVLMTDKGENPVYIDQFKKNHLYTAKELCLMPIINNLAANSQLNFRIEGQTYSISQLQEIILAYQSAIENKAKVNAINPELRTVRAGYTLGALSF
ncbi:MAG: U32 family peptidase [Bacillus sp. (in: Bacteria)]|nr:U32 family peptidase [Bacillus sp. (in: firmicutes)]